MGPSAPLSAHCKDPFVQERRWNMNKCHAMRCSLPATNRQQDSHFLSYTSMQFWLIKKPIACWNKNVHSAKQQAAMAAQPHRCTLMASDKGRGDLVNLSRPYVTRNFCCSKNLINKWGFVTKCQVDLCITRLCDLIFLLFFYAISLYLMSNMLLQALIWLFDIWKGVIF